MTSEHPVNLNRLIKCHIRYWWKNKFQVKFPANYGCNRVYMFTALLLWISNMRLQLISSISAIMSLWSPRMSLTLVLELSIKHCMRISVLLITVRSKRPNGKLKRWTTWSPQWRIKECTQMLTNGKQFMFYIRHPSQY
jgi:hypothetical protein